MVRSYGLVPAAFAWGMRVHLAPWTLPRTYFWLAPGTLAPYFRLEQVQ